MIKQASFYCSGHDTIIEYEIDLPYSSKETRTNEPFKTSHEEYFIWNTFTFVGTVGGTLGLFLGFSFQGTFDWLWGRLPQQFCKNNKSNKQHRQHAMKKKKNHPAGLTGARKWKIAKCNMAHKSINMLDT